MEEEPVTSLTREGAEKAAGVVPAGTAAPDVKIRWALLDDKLVNIHRIPDGGSSRCRCLVCQQRLIPRRGPKASWHFAHEKGAPPCPLHSDEVLKRLEAKILLKEALGGLTSLTIVVTCRSRRGARAGHLNVPHEWIAGWDEVKVDTSTNGGAPDVLLLNDGRPIAAIEVRGATALGAGKEAALRQIGVPWVETSVDDVLRWSHATPLSVYRLEPEGWLCAMCRAETHATRNRAPQAEVHEARLHELRDQGLLRLLWVKEYAATFDHRSWTLELHICDIVDEFGTPLHRLLVNGDYDFVVAGMTAEELASGLAAPRNRFKAGKQDWLESLGAVGINVTEVAPGWRTVAEPGFLYDTDAARQRLRDVLRRRVHQPEVLAACRILGVQPTDGIREIKSARNRLARMWHPDLAPVEDVVARNARMREINGAFDLLCAFHTNETSEDGV